MSKVVLDLEGMSCASCAAHIERRLNDLDGVEASVNFATEKAAVRYDGERVAVDNLLAAVADSGYGASVATEDEPERRRARASRKRPSRMSVVMTAATSK